MSSRDAAGLVTTIGARASEAARSRTRLRRPNQPALPGQRAPTPRGTLIAAMPFLPGLSGRLVPSVRECSARRPVRKALVRGRISWRRSLTRRLDRALAGGAQYDQTSPRARPHGHVSLSARNTSSHVASSERPVVSIRTAFGRLVRYSSKSARILSTSPPPGSSSIDWTCQLASRRSAPRGHPDRHSASAGADPPSDEQEWTCRRATAR